MPELEIVREQLKRHEGFKAKPYRCSAGALTIGYGTNLDARGITREEAERLMMNEVYDCVKALQRKLGDTYNNLNANRKAVLINMAYNMGISGLMNFKNTLRYIKQGNYEQASENMLVSQWADQVGNRAKELSEIMKIG